MKNMKIAATITGVLIILLSFMNGAEAQQKDHSEQNGAIFPNGKLAPAKYFTGKARVTGLIDNDSVFTTAAGSVTFEAGARSNWHSHPAGQILIVTAGTGYHQVKGQPKESIKKGDVIKCPPGVEHWHGATENNSMTHIYIIPNTEKGIVEWGQPVTNEEFSK